MNLIIKCTLALCAFLESNPILDHITRIAMSDPAYADAMVGEELSKQKKAGGKRKIAGGQRAGEGV